MPLPEALPVITRHLLRAHHHHHHSPSLLHLMSMMPMMGMGLRKSLYHHQAAIDTSPGLFLPAVGGAAGFGFGGGGGIAGGGVGGKSKSKMKIDTPLSVSISIESRIAASRGDDRERMGILKGIERARVGRLGKVGRVGRVASVEGRVLGEPCESHGLGWGSVFGFGSVFGSASASAGAGADASAGANSGGRVWEEQIYPPIAGWLV
ncbi:hypothetical protein NHQ30_008194 [Ciborinia camelliae]|nr:hypothetical protein NHQ30_008194 [Ciborinia camelliae]